MDFEQLRLRYMDENHEEQIRTSIPDDSFEEATLDAEVKEDDN